MNAPMPADHPETRVVDVTQADREAAAANIVRRLKWQHGGEQPWMDAATQSMRLGEQDDHDEVQAFARHRLRSTDQQEMLREALSEQAFVNRLSKALSVAYRRAGGIARIARATNGAAIIRNIATLEAAAIYRAALTGSEAR